MRRAAVLCPVLWRATVNRVCRTFSSAHCVSAAGSPRGKFSSLLHRATAYDPLSKLVPDCQVPRPVLGAQLRVVHQLGLGHVVLAVHVLVLRALRVRR